MTDYIYGLRAIIEAIDAGKEVDKIFIKKDINGDTAQRLIKLARANEVPVQRVPVEKLNKFTRKNHQGVVALRAEVHYYKLQQVVPALYEEGVLPFVVVLDSITDVRNFGAIGRTAECCGVNAIVIPDRHSVGVGADAVKTSSGALLTLPVCREHSLAGAVRYLKESGYTVIGVTEKSSVNYTTLDYTGPVALVMGAEDTGISEDVLALCDGRAAIPMFGQIGSLNVSVAAGVVMYEVVRQRLAADAEII